MGFSNGNRGGSPPDGNDGFGVGDVPVLATPDVFSMVSGALEIAGCLRHTYRTCPDLHRGAFGNTATGQKRSAILQVVHDTAIYAPIR